MRLGRCIILPVLLAGISCYGTTVIIVVTPTGIVGGTDDVAKGFALSGKPILRSDIAKIQLIRGKFIVANIGMARGPAYSFESWITNVGNKLSPDGSLIQFVALIENEAAKTFKDDMAIEHSMRAGELIRGEPFKDSLVEYIVAGYQDGVPTIIRTHFNLDWHENRLVGPVRDVTIFQPRGSVMAYGVVCGIEEFTNINSYSYKSFNSHFPTILSKVTSGSDLTQQEGITVIRSLISIQADITPTQVGRNSTIAILPMEGPASVSSYPAIFGLQQNTLPKNHR